MFSPDLGHRSRIAIILSYYTPVKTKCPCLLPGLRLFIASVMCDFQNLTTFPYKSLQCNGMANGTLLHRIVEKATNLQRIIKNEPHSTFDKRANFQRDIVF